VGNSALPKRSALEDMLAEYRSKKIIASLDSGDEWGSGGHNGGGNQTDYEGEFANVKSLSYPHTTTLSPRTNDAKPITMTATINLVDDFVI
jgi:hypothetical protein